uniref:Uncharacterized protein n=1 Tax=Paramoeba aestuarina TaxID=180227 RepID=A0A7S4L074_9EUKA|mmetsp:Transcript_29181/g.45124  ORF Transcript_29181/g.45124 Transcript_29181/m.45124 type:complete len:150 (+) Transcript_29181:469-918(+)
MNTQDILINEYGKWKVIEYFCKIFPCVRRSVFIQALIIKSIDLCDLTTLVISANQTYLAWIAYFQKKENSEALHRMEASVDKVSHEHVAGIRNVPANSEKLKQIEELAVYVTNYGTWSGKTCHIVFFQKDFLRSRAEILERRLFQWLSK